VNGNCVIHSSLVLAVQGG